MMNKTWMEKLAAHDQMTTRHETVKPPRLKVADCKHCGQAVYRGEARRYYPVEELWGHDDCHDEKEGWSGTKKGAQTLEELKKLEEQRRKEQEDREGRTKEEPEDDLRQSTGQPGVPIIHKQLMESLQEENRIGKVSRAIRNERRSQNGKWGKQRHEYGQWLAILGEEFGEVCEAMQEHMGLTTMKPTDANDLYKELIQLAAVAQAIAEQISEE